MAKKTGLGRGLSALISGTSADIPAVPVPRPAVSPVPAQTPPDDPTSRIVRLPVDSIAPGAHQARQTFNESALKELAASIREQGVLMPLLVRPVANGYELIAGERRLRAAKRAGLTEVPAIVRTDDDRETHEISLIENIQRENLNPIEEAQAYRALMDRYGYTQEALSARLGKSRSTVANLLRLLNLPDAIRNEVAGGRLSAGHARAILALSSQSDQEEVAKQVLAAGLSVRETERLVGRRVDGSETPRKSVTKLNNKEKSPYPYLVDDLRERLATKVSIRGDAEKGVIEIHYFSADELTRIVDRIGR